MLKIKDKSYRFIVDVLSDKGHNITINNIYDARTDKNWTPEQIRERGLFGMVCSPMIMKNGHIIDNTLEELKQTLCWNLNGDCDKYKIGFIPSEKGSWGRAFIYQQRK